MSQNDSLSSESANHPVWDVYDEMRTARLNIKCLSVEIGILERRSRCIEVILAITIVAVLATMAVSTYGKYREKARISKVLTAPCRAEIALANGRLYARDNEWLICWNLKK